MSVRQVIDRVRAMGPANRALLAESGIVLAVASAAIRVLPFRTVVRAAARFPARAKRSHTVTIAQVRWAVQTWAARVPWRAVCFQRGLALHFMLRRRGIPSVLHYGVGNLADGRLMAHVWITAHGEYVLGGETAHEYACLASYPAPEL